MVLHLTPGWRQSWPSSQVMSPHSTGGKSKGSVEPSPVELVVASVEPVDSVAPVASVVDAEEELALVVVVFADVEDVSSPAQATTLRAKVRLRERIDDRVAVAGARVSVGRSPP